MICARLKLLPCASAVVLIGGCSSFNMSPACHETGPGLMRYLAVPIDVRPNFDRLSRIMSVADFHELEAGYNSRICSAAVAGPSQGATIIYKVAQSEGLQDWYLIEVSNGQDPSVKNLIEELQYAYGTG